MAYQDPLGVPHADHADPRDCPGCALLKVQLREILQAQNGLTLREILDIVSSYEEDGHPDDTRPPQ
ncbi:hypothetical protein [Streptomyces gilvosporeus]|uniref:hypothetical protein n=1 Tax=Streptomyces gilvosporeus TaxID=553510 RepID=UPI00131D3C63|nr:hypothetical protein [Streptomyces gilvosporeus]